MAVHFDLNSSSKLEIDRNMIFMSRNNFQPKSTCQGAVIGPLKLSTMKENRRKKFIF